jgi:hypothetical protein
MSSFWRSWLTIWCAAVGLFGLVLTGAAFESTDGVARALMTVMGPVAPVFDAPLRFSVALMGAVTLGWGLTLAITIRALDHVPTAQAAPLWRALTGAVVIWFVVDSAVSIVTGFALNAASNAAFLLAYLIPVLASGALRQDQLAAATRPRTV